MALCLVVASAVVMMACAGAAGSGAGTSPASCPQCVERARCSLHFTAEIPVTDPLGKQLGCGPTFQYHNGANEGVLGGNGSFCVDSPQNRKLLHDSHKRGFLPGYCETCLGVPPGKLFVFWTLMIGPTCPSSCVPGEAPPSF